MQSAPVEAFCFKPFSSVPGASWIVTFSMRRLHFPEWQHGADYLGTPQARAVVDDFGSLVIVERWL